MRLLIEVESKQKNQKPNMLHNNADIDTITNEDYNHEILIANG